MKQYPLKYVTSSMSASFIDMSSLSVMTVQLDTAAILVFIFGLVMKVLNQSQADHVTSTQG